MSRVYDIKFSIYDSRYISDIDNSIVFEVCEEINEAIEAANELSGEIIMDIGFWDYNGHLPEFITVESIHLKKELLK